ncbi:HEPN domain-containing protein [Candidatus Bathyarchaeota archaeon]|nr:HEPN domain-containing protein [Candidatus Bathyarchaeota archaeon]
MRGKLEEAEKALRAGLPDATVILAYTAMFHAARGVLFRDGIVERSRVCLIEYLRERYVKTGRMSEALINTLNTARVDRHEALYGLETRSSEREAKHSLRRAEEFLSMVKTIL